jgi:predicted lipoprotein with Yx(FWY)xxD motif
MKRNAWTVTRSTTAATVTVAAAMMLGLPAARAGAARVLPTTPAGITLVEVVLEGGTSQPVLQWVRIGDADGRTLLAYDQDTASTSQCLDACAQEFRPLAAARDARVFGDWSLVRRADGSRQWAYQGHPLYTWAKEQEPGKVSENVAEAQHPGQSIRYRRVKAAPLLPPHGWQVVHFNPSASLALPDGIDARLVSSAQAVALVDVSGLTLYSFDGDVRHDGQQCAASSCNVQWMPLPAPEIAVGTGEFSIVTRGDGARQWAYKGRPLYTYKGDKLPGDVYGDGVDRRWTVAKVTANFSPPHVAIRSLDGYGDVVAFDGGTLYGGYPFEKRWGGRNLRDTFLHNAYYKGKQLGGGACVDATCLKAWHPLQAPADAQSDGFWEPIKRPDGTRQWAYKGYALYTFAGDKTPGEHTGQAVYAFEKVEGSETELQQAFFIQSISQAPGGVGIYWNIAKP